MPFLNGLAASLSHLSPIRAISDWMHERTVREQNSHQAEIERLKVELEKERIELERLKLAAERENSMRLVLLEIAKIEIADEQQQRNHCLEMLRLLISEGHLSRSTSKDIVTLMMDDNFRVGTGASRRERLQTVTDPSSVSKLDLSDAKSPQLIGGEESSVTPTNGFR